MRRANHNYQFNSRFPLGQGHVYGGGPRALALPREDNEIIQNLLTYWTVDYGTVWKHVDAHVAYLRAKGEDVLTANGFQTLLRETHSPLFKSVLLVSLIQKSGAAGHRSDIFHRWRRSLISLLSADTSLDISLYSKTFQKIPGTAKRNDAVKITFFGSSEIVLRASGICELKERLSPEEAKIVLENGKLMIKNSLWGKEVYEKVYHYLFDESMQVRQMKAANELLGKLEKSVLNGTLLLRAPFRTTKYLTGCAKFYSHDQKFARKIRAGFFAGIMIPQIFYEGNRKCYEEQHGYQTKVPKVVELFKSKRFDNFESFKTDEVTQKLLSIELLGHLKMLMIDGHYNYWKRHLNRETMLHPVFAFCAYIGNVELFRMVERYISSCRNLNVADGEFPAELLEVDNVVASKHRIVHNTLMSLYIKTGKRENYKYEIESSNHFLFFSSPLIAAIVFGRSEMIEYLMRKLPEDKQALISGRVWMEKLFLTFREGPCHFHVKDFIRKYKKTKPKPLPKEPKEVEDTKEAIALNNFLDNSDVTEEEEEGPPVENLMKIRKEEGKEERKTKSTDELDI